MHDTGPNSSSYSPPCFQSTQHLSFSSVPHGVVIPAVSRVLEVSEF